jgi:glutamyl/glutaminyl-tRNA synthetase
MRDIISRFAPAPTGLLHLGHVVNALAVWEETRARASTGSARAGKVLLRIEDHDRQRSRRDFEDAILEDLAWLGFVADAPLVRQSERNDTYIRALDGLRRQRLVYACRCSRAEIEEASPGDEELRYPGTCRDRGLAEGPGLGLRVRLERSVERFVDARLGPQEQIPSEQCGDLLVRDRDGNWTYQFCAAVDDHVQGVTFVVRGMDLLASTGRQLQLARLLGRVDPPEFLHHRLAMKSPTQKLSKSDRDAGVRELRRAGWTAAQVLDLARRIVS